MPATSRSAWARPGWSRSDEPRPRRRGWRGGKPAVVVFDGEGILLDVEGTTSSIAFVHETLFGFARDHMPEFLAGHGEEPRVAELVACIVAEADRLAVESDGPGDAAAAAAELMASDAKFGPLKELQGMVWRQGFESGELVAHLFDDVPPALARWRDAGLDVRIFSSGSVEAQRLFFAHTAVGDLSGLLRGHYDTTTGAKRDPESYRRIAADYGCEPRKILFVSDVVDELDAARAAGMATALAVRPGNPPAEAATTHEPIHSFDDIVS